MSEEEALTRPIIGIENRTAQEVFDIMADRIRRSSPAQAVSDDMVNCALDAADYCRNPDTAKWMRAALTAAIAAHPAPSVPPPLPEDHFLTAYASKDGKITGIDHDTNASWQDVLAAHIALRDWLNERIANQQKCPRSPPSAHIHALVAPPPLPGEVGMPGHRVFQREVLAWANSLKERPDGAAVADLITTLGIAIDNDRARLLTAQAAEIADMKAELAELKSTR